MGRTVWSVSAQAKYEAENGAAAAPSSKSEQSASRSRPREVREGVDVPTWVKAPFDVDEPLRDDAVYEAFIDPSAPLTSSERDSAETERDSSESERNGSDPSSSRFDCPDGYNSPEDVEPVTPSSGVFHSHTLPLTLPTNRLGRSSPSPSTPPLRLSPVPRTAYERGQHVLRLAGIEPMPPRNFSMRNEAELALQF